MRIEVETWLVVILPKISVRILYVLSMHACFSSDSKITHNAVLRWDPDAMLSKPGRTRR
jgi:hypothetical protein